MLVQAAAPLPIHFPATPWHIQQWPCTADGLGCLDQLETTTTFLAAAFQRSLLTPLKTGELFTTYQRALERRWQRSFCKDLWLLVLPATSEMVYAGFTSPGPAHNTSDYVLEMCVSVHILWVYFSPHFVQLWIQEKIINPWWFQVTPKFH